MEKSDLMGDEDAVTEIDQKGDMGDDVQEMRDGEAQTIDTTPAFHSIFQGKDNFDSWEEFITPFEEFQMLTNSVFKPKSSVCVNWINEKRSSDKIPEKFVYSKVNMICQHFGIGVRKEGSTRKRESYVGQDCEAFVKLSYKKGSLHITKYNLIHTNHSLSKSVAQSQMRRIRPVIFDDGLDLLLCKVSEDCNVFENRTAEANWQNAVTHLTEADTRMEHLTRRMLKKRLHFLMERYGANCEGSAPLEDDEMGQILHRLLTQKEKIMTPIIRGRRGRKRKHDTPTSTGRPRGRPRKYPIADNDEEDDDDFGGGDLDMIADDDDDDNTPRTRSSSNGISSGSKNALSNAEISSFLHYWTKRDADERRMRWEEVRLRKEELELQKSRFEMEQKERQTLLELLKAQSQIVNSLRKAPVGHVQAAVTPSKAASATKEFILNKDGTLQPVMSEHDEHKVQTATVMTVNSHGGMGAHTGTMNPMSGHVATMPGHSQTGTMAPHQVHQVSMAAHGMATHQSANMAAPQIHGTMATHGHAGTMHGHSGMPGHGGMGGHMPGHH